MNWKNNIIEQQKKISLLVESSHFSKSYGVVKSVSGTQVEASMPGARVGELCEIIANTSNDPILAEVVGFTHESTILATLSPPDAVGFEDAIIPLQCRHKIRVHPHIFGEVFDGLGRNLLAGKIDIFSSAMHSDSNEETPVICDAVKPTSKPRIVDPLFTGIRAIDGMITLCEGQRIGLFAGAGCGKTTLLASLARGCSADAIVFALVGERGRELKEFLDHELGDALKKKSVLICATSDRSSMERSRAAFTATAVAEVLRDQGKKVLLLVDSLTRFARAQREIGLASGEPPAKGGFPPSVYTMLPKLIERAGKTEKGSITAVYTLLLEGDAMSDPIADEAKSLLDGHIVLSRKLAEKGHYPAIDVLKSLSRTMSNVVNEELMDCATHMRSLLSQYDDMELLIRLGEYTEGQDEFSDLAVNQNESINNFLKQGTRETEEYENLLSQMKSIREN